jgi:hypothetical protein
LINPMKAVVITACAVLAAGCGTSAAPHPTAAHKPTTAATVPAATPSAVTVDAAGASERTFANWLASSSTDWSPVANAISGPVMREYVKFQALWDEAMAANGQPVAPETVSTIPGGYQLCATSNGGTSCDSFTGWQTDGQGHITDLDVNGQLIAPRLAVGKPDTGSQLAISNVISYRPGNSNEVYVAYKVSNVSGQTFGNGNPAWLAVFDASGGQEFQEDENNSVIPSNLQPGESAVELVAFATQTPTGEFSLRTNDQLETELTASDLQSP